MFHKKVVLRKEAYEFSPDSVKDKVASFICFTKKSRLHKEIYEFLPDLDNGKYIGFYVNILDENL